MATVVSEDVSLPTEGPRFGTPPATTDAATVLLLAEGAQSEASALSVEVMVVVVALRWRLKQRPQWQSGIPLRE